MGRDLELADLTESRWDVLVAAGYGPGWSRELFAVTRASGVAFNVLCGSHLVAEEVDAETAVNLYNLIAADGKNFAVENPES